VWPIFAWSIACGAPSKVNIDGESAALSGMDVELGVVRGRDGVHDGEPEAESSGVVDAVRAGSLEGLE
jgi:hypothetical protein